MAAYEPAFEVFEELGVSGVVNFSIGVEGTAVLEVPVPSSGWVLGVSATYEGNSIRNTIDGRRAATNIDTIKKMRNSINWVKVDVDMFLEEGVLLYPITNKNS